MKAAVFYGINDVRVEERSTPQLLPGDVLIEVKACAICGTDLRIIRNGHKAVKPPAVIGHEIVGVIKSVGKGIDNLCVGESVVVVTPVGCGKCRFCKAGHQNMCRLVSRQTHSLGYYCDGGFAEFMRIPAEAVRNKNLIKFDKNAEVSYEELSLVEPFSCVINGQEFLKIQPGESLVIFGCGAIGCMHAYLARHAGASRIIMVDKDKKRIDMVSRLGIADKLICSQQQDAEKEVYSVTNGEGADNVVVACSSSQAQKLAFSISGIRGKISLFAGLTPTEQRIEIDANDIHYLEKSVFGAFASGHQQYQQAIKLILGQKITLKKLISQVLPLEDFNRAIEMLANGDVFKVVIKPS